MEHWKTGEPGLTEKSRDGGLSWLAVSVACTVCLFRRGVVIGFGSRKEEYVDKIGAPKSLFYKARMFMRHLPKEFKGSWDENLHAPNLRLKFVDTGSHISGEGGDNIGRGDRTSIYFVDEAAYLEHPELVEASLSQTTNCRIDISSANGMGNPFAQKRHSGLIDVFTFHWRDDPRKDQAWYEKQCRNLNPVTVAQEIDINYSASAEGVLIPGAWVQAAIDSHIKLGIEPTGARRGAFDVADEGKDKNCFVGSHGVLIEFVEEWSGKGSDIFASVQRCFHLCDMRAYEGFKFDSDGLGADVRGDARIINELRGGKNELLVTPFRGSEAVVNPEREDVPGRKNKDLFLNRKAQSWWSLRRRFEQTYLRVRENVMCPDDDIISISSTLKLLNHVCNELSQPTYSITATGKLTIDKAPNGAKSPNTADAIMINFSGGTLPPRPMRFQKIDWMAI